MLEAWTGYGWGLIANIHKGTFSDDRNILYLDCGGSFNTIYTCQNSSYYITTTCKFHRK